MKGYCVVATKGAAKTIHNVFLVDSREGVDPVEAIKEHSRKYATLPWPVQYWDDHPNDILWFPVKQVEILKSIDWPLDCGTMEEEYKIQIQVCRAFEIEQLTLVQALEKLDNEVIDRAIGLGWKPITLKESLEALAWAMPESGQAEAYREEITDMIEDVPLAVEATEVIYQYNADEFLEEDGKPPGPKDPKDMTDEDLIEEAKQLHRLISATEDNRRHYALETEIFNRDYEIRVSNTNYSVQKIEEE